MVYLKRVPDESWPGEPLRNGRHANRNEPGRGTRREMRGRIRRVIFVIEAGLPQA